MKKTLLRSVLLMLLILSLAGVMAVGVHAAGASSYGPESGVKDVCVFLPYDGTARNNFSALEHVGETVAAYTGGELLCYKGTEATIDRLAAAVEKCAVVIIGSHGNSGTFGLTTDNGLTAHDYACGHASDDGERTKKENGNDVLDYHLWSVDGTTIADHMTKDAPGNLVVLCSCEGMKTDRFCAPLRNKGVSVVYGYSESVSSNGDLTMASVFLNGLCERMPVSEAFWKMKAEMGQSWDASQGNYTLEEARQYGIAFPIIVSAEDPYPGMGNVSFDQVSDSPWKLPVRTDVPEKNVLMLNADRNTVIAETRDPVREVSIAAGGIPSGTSLSVSGNQVVLTGKPDKKGYTVATLKITTEKNETITKPVGCLVADYSSLKASSQDVALDALSVQMWSNAYSFTNVGGLYEIWFNFDTSASTFDIRRFSGCLPVSLEFGYDPNVKGRAYIRTSENRIRGNSYLATPPGEYSVTLDYFTMAGEVFRHTVNITVKPKHSYTPMYYLYQSVSLSFRRYDEVSIGIQREVKENQFTHREDWPAGSVTRIEITEGSLPKGMYVANSFLKPCGLYGTPTESGDFTATIRVTTYQDTYDYYYKIHVDDAEKLTGTVKLNGSVKHVGDTLDFTVTDAPGEPYKIQWQYSHYKTDWYDIAKHAADSTWYANSSFAKYYIRVKITKDGYGGALYSDYRYINPVEDLTGKIYIVNNPSPGVKAFTGFTGLINSLYQNEEAKVHCQWQISDDGVSGWTDISGQKDRGYTPTSADLGKYIRLTATADGFAGSVISAAKQVSKPGNYADPVTPQLTSEIPYDHVTVLNAKTDQEYLVTYSAAAPGDWTGAEHPSSDGELTLSCEKNRTVYVHTRMRETEEKAAGTKSSYNKTYSGVVTALADFVLDQTSFKTKVGDVTPLTVSPLPSNVSGWDDYEVEWYVNGTEAEIYTDAACTIPVPDGMVTCKTVYVKGITPTHSVTVGVEKQLGLADIRIAQCVVEIADSDGDFVLQHLDLDTVTTFPGDTVTTDYTTDPSPAKVGDLSFEKNSGPESDLLLTDNEDGTVSIHVPDGAKDGTYYYSVLVDGTATPILSAIRINVVSDKASVTLDANNGLGETVKTVVDLGSEFILPELPESFTVPDGYEFDGWDAGDAGDSFNVGENVTVLAKWAVHVHTIVKVPAADPTCESDGTMEHYCCTSCGKTFTDEAGTAEAAPDSFTVPAAGHKPEHVPAKEPSCQENGNKEYYECSVCGKWFADAAGTAEITDYRDVILSAPGHDWSEWTETKPATVYEEGEESRTCSRCGETETQPVPALDYDPDEEIPFYPFFPITKPDAPETPVTPAEPAAPVLPFTDVTPASPYYDDIEFVYENDIMIGMSETEFGENLPLTRGMIVTVLWRMEGRPDVGYAGTFTDVPAGMWYTDGVEWAASKGIVLGYGDGRYGPDDDVTREQLAAILYRYAKFKGRDVSIGEDTNILSYYDAFIWGDWAVPALQWACGSGVLEDAPVGMLRPTEPATRGEIAHAIRVFLEAAAE